MSRRLRILIGCAIILSVLILGFAIPQPIMIPVEGATRSDWNAESFWYEPWGESGVHKGIDIFAARGTPTVAATRGVVLFAGELRLGGKVVVILGPKWRLHYYAHLDWIAVAPGDSLGLGDMVGAVGDSGNARGKSPHLHYTIVSIFPYPWRVTGDTQGWKRMFYLDPDESLRSGGEI